MLALVFGSVCLFWVARCCNLSMGEKPLLGVQYSNSAMYTHNNRESLGLDIVSYPVHSTSDRHAVVGEYPMLYTYSLQDAKMSQQRVGHVSLYKDFAALTHAAPVHLVQVESTSTIPLVPPANSNICILSSNRNVLDNLMWKDRGILLSNHWQFDCTTAAGYRGIAVYEKNLTQNLVDCARAQKLVIGVVGLQKVEDIRRVVCQYHVDFVISTKPVLFKNGVNCDPNRITAVHASGLLG